MAAPHFAHQEIVDLEHDVTARKSLVRSDESNPSAGWVDQNQPAIFSPRGDDTTAKGREFDCSIAGRHRFVEGIGEDCSAKN